MKREKIVPALFLTLLLVGALLIFAAPKDEDGIADDENRTLAKFPEFTLKSVLSGEYTQQINEYLKDNFPFREAMIATGDKINSLLTISTGAGDDGVEVLASAVDHDMGAGENLFTDEIKEAVEDAVKEEALPKAAHIDVAEEADYNSNGIIISGVRAMELFGYYDGMLENYAAKINNIKAALPDVNVYSFMVPTAVEFYSPEKYHTGMRSQKDAITKLYALLDPEVKPVDVYTYVAANADEYLYFRTDHHWTGRGAYQGYYAFCKAAGLDAVPLEDFPAETIADSFVGTLYRYTKKQVLKDYPDQVEVFYPPEVESCTGYYSADMSAEGYEVKLIENPEKTTNKYLAFTGGDHALLKIVTNNKNGRRLLVSKDSFGNALVPFLTNHYEEIYVVDPRSVEISVADFCAEHEINDFIIENYTFCLSNSAILQGLSSMVN